MEGEEPHVENPVAEEAPVDNGNVEAVEEPAAEMEAA
jgi:hypothetical protein